MATRRGWDDPWHKYAESKPIRTSEGIATRKQRGAMSQTWWSKRLVEVLDSYGLGTRMQRGRRYARQGQLLTLDVQPGVVIGQVQGSRRTPYLASVTFAPLTDDQWAAVRTEIDATLRFAARLLAGEVPPELENVFDRAGVALLPRAWSDLRASCSCPDWEVPCKHIAALLYVLADRLDDDPWLLLAWRGRTRDELLARLGSRDAGVAGAAPWWPLVPGAPLPNPAPQGSGDWATPGATLARLGPLDVSVRKAPATELIERLYDAVSATATART